MTHDDAAQQVLREFAAAVPEVAAGVVEVRAVGRRTGRWTKVAVTSRDPAVDAVAACVGVRGSRVNDIVAGLGGERVDIVRWSDEPDRLIANLLQPARTDTVVLDTP